MLVRNVSPNSGSPLRAFSSSRCWTWRADILSSPRLCQYALPTALVARPARQGRVNRTRELAHIAADMATAIRRRLFRLVCATRDGRVETAASCKTAQTWAGVCTACASSAGTARAIQDGTATIARLQNAQRIATGMESATLLLETAIATLAGRVVHVPSNNAWETVPQARVSATTGFAYATTGGPAKIVSSIRVNTSASETRATASVTARTSAASVRLTGLVTIAPWRSVPTTAQATARA